MVLKSPAYLSVNSPCQEYDHAPLSVLILFPLGPTTRMLGLPFNGSILLLFFNNVIDSEADV